MSIPFRLRRLLETIHMHSQGIGANHSDGLLHLLRGKRGVASLGNQLGGADIRDQKGSGGMAARHAIAGSHSGIDNSSTLAANAERQTILFSGTSQVTIDFSNIGMATRQRRDKNRVAQLPTEEGDRGIDLVHVYLRESLMHQMDIIPIGTLRNSNTLFQSHLDMLYFALFNLVSHKKWWSFLPVSVYSRQ